MEDSCSILKKTSPSEGRIAILDAMKGCAIILMIINHVTLEGLWTPKFIGVFHMPLFFLISGYLYKQRSFTESFKHSCKKILLPYLLTCIIIFFLLCFFKGKSECMSWFFAAIWANSKPINFLGYTLNVGPLWFLPCFFLSIMLVNVIFDKIENFLLRWLFLIISFTISVILLMINKGTLLPLGLTTAWGGVVFLFIGIEIKRNEVKLRYFFKGRLLICGLFVWIVCVVYGQCAMSWHIYKLYFLQIIGAVYGTYICYLIVNQLEKTSFSWRLICFIGRNTLAVLSIHSIDWALDFTRIASRQILQFLDFSNDVFLWQTEVLLKLFFVIIVLLLVCRNKFVRKYYFVETWSHH